MVYIERSAPLEKSVAFITSGRNKLTIHGQRYVLVEKLCMLIVILPAIYGQIVLLFHHTTLYGHQFFLLRFIVRIFCFSYMLMGMSSLHYLSM